MQVNSRWKRQGASQVSDIDELWYGYTWQMGTKNTTDLMSGSEFQKTVYYRDLWRYRGRWTIWCLSYLPSPNNHHSWPSPGDQWFQPPPPGAYLVHLDCAMVPGPSSPLTGFRGWAPGSGAASYRKKSKVRNSWIQPGQACSLLKYHDISRASFF